MAIEGNIHSSAPRLGRSFSLDLVLVLHLPLWSSNPSTHLLAVACPIPFFNFSIWTFCARWLSCSRHLFEPSDDILAWRTGEKRRSDFYSLAFYSRGQHFHVCRCSIVLSICHFRQPLCLFFLSHTNPRN